MNPESVDEDYDGLVKAAADSLRAVEGRLLQQVLVQVVEPEYNVLYLIFEDGAVAINGQIGGEVLGIFPIAEVPSLGSHGPNAAVIPYRPFEVFQDKRLTQGRSIGTAWNGHGFEFSFEELPGTTMIVQSIYAADSPRELSDCLRLGVARYSLECWLNEKTIAEQIAFVTRKHSHEL